MRSRAPARRGAGPWRAVLLGAVCVLALGGALAYVVAARHDRSVARQAAAPVATTSLARVLAAPHIVFRNTNPRVGYGDLAVASLAAPDGPRAITHTECDRVYAAGAATVCLSSSAGVVTTYAAHILDDRQRRVQTLPLTGIPSRARLSADGRLVATTSFTAGDSYAGTSFSTRTVITRVGGAVVGDLEQFTLHHDGQVIDPVDRNYWGVTFAADDHTFYATVAWSGHTWLVRGDTVTRSVVTLHEDAECPSLSPDGTHIVYKQRGNLPPGKWRLVDYDVATGRVVPLAETRSVDDQAAWLDDTHVLYGLPRTGAAAATDDIWMVPSDGSGTPRVIIHDAWSPAVVR